MAAVEGVLEEGKEEKTKEERLSTAILLSHRI